MTFDVLVTDGDERSTVAVVRSLGRMGLSVAVAEKRLNSLSGCSKYCSGQFVFPPPAVDPSGFLRALLKHVESHSFKLVIPMTDLTCTLCAEIATELGQHTKLALPEVETYLRASDKAELLKLAAALDVPVPRSYFPENETELSDMADEFTYPIVIKSRRSRVRTDNGFLFGHVTYAASKEELLRKFSLSHQSIPRPIIQERVDGPGCGLFVICREGEILATFAHRRLREKPPSGGVSVLRESAPLDERICAYSAKLLRALRWTGVAMVEFKLDQSDNSYRLMEINGRFWGSLQLAVNCGLDFPYWVYQLSQRVQPVPPPDYPVGVRLRWVLGDLDHLLAIWTRKRAKLSLPEGYPGRLTVLKDFLLECFGSTPGEMWTQDDPGPGRREAADYVRNLFRLCAR